jgi:hypothetical protein
MGPPPEGANLARMIVSAYLSRAHLDDVEGSCPLIGLSTDVARGGATVKAAFAETLEMMVSAFSSQLGPDRKAAHEKALGIAALWVGGMVPARAVGDPATADDLREAARKLAVTIGAWEEPPAEPSPHGLRWLDGRTIDSIFGVPIIMVLLAVLGHTLRRTNSSEARESRRVVNRTPAPRLLAPPGRAAAPPHKGPTFAVGSSRRLDLAVVRRCGSLSIFPYNSRFGAFNSRFG